MSRPRKRIIIMGAAGRDFHNFNVLYRDNPEYEVVAFTAGQLPNIAGRIYPPELAGRLYPRGIPIYPEEEIGRLIEEYGVDEVVLSYSDLKAEDIVWKDAVVNTHGADFKLLGVDKTMIRPRKAVIAVTASRTGAGKSTVSRWIARLLRELGVPYVVVRHPMPYGDLREMVVQRFASLEDLERYKPTIEEREEYEPHLREGSIVYAGVDYGRILEEAEREAEVILWDGGNNDWPFYKPGLYITVVDPTRPGDELSSYPGLINLMEADVVVVNKVNIAREEDVERVLHNVRKANTRARIVLAASEVSVDRPDLIRGKRVLVVEDGPTVTHGSLGTAAGYTAAVKYGAKEIVDPRPYAVGSIKETYEKYPHLGPVLPAMGYGEQQIRELEETINRVPADTVILGTPADLSRIMNLNKPSVHVSYEMVEAGGESLGEIVREFLRRKGLV